MYIGRQGLYRRLGRRADGAPRLARDGRGDIRCADAVGTGQRTPAIRADIIRAVGLLATLAAAVSGQDGSCASQPAGRKNQRDDEGDLRDPGCHDPLCCWARDCAASRSALRHPDGSNPPRAGRLTACGSNPRLRMMWMRSMALVLAIGMTPVVSEVVEIAVHLVEHGDLSHYSGDEQPAGDEHGCSVLCHSCGQASGVALSMKPSADPRPVGGSRADFAPLPPEHGRAATPPPHPPPIA